MGEHDRGRPRWARPLRRHRLDPERVRREGAGLRHRARRGHLQLLGLPVLDGSRSACAWGTDTDAVKPGDLRPEHLPSPVPRRLRDELERQLLAREPQAAARRASRASSATSDTARTLRTRIGLIMTQAAPGRQRRPRRAPGFTRQTCRTWSSATASTRGELLRDDLVAMCRSMPGGIDAQLSGPGATWATPATCSPPGICTRTSARTARSSSAASGIAPRRRALALVHPFDSADPVHTPNALDTSNPEVRLALGDAIPTCSRRHIPLTRRSARRAEDPGGGARSTAAPATRTATSTRSTRRSPPAPASALCTTARRYVQAVTWDS